ncbi:hypothetical protein [Streptomyces lavendulae]|uniref:hypothetical protein n=1 Tax=Streptomyces lavendulae TaxID=1914 RepID=UPI0031E9F450
MDVESLAVELFGLRLAEFTAARDEYVAKARKAGDREHAAAIAALRKPTVTAWAAGLLARRRPKEAHSLVQLGEALRTAHRTLDAGQLRQLSHDQHVLIQQLARTARALAAEAGQAVSEPVLHEVEQILHAVLADPGMAAQWMAGRLVKAPDAALGSPAWNRRPAPRLLGGWPGPPDLPRAKNGRGNRMPKGGRGRRAASVRRRRRRRRRSAWRRRRPPRRRWRTEPVRTWRRPRKRCGLRASGWRRLARHARMRPPA